MSTTWGIALRPTAHLLLNSGLLQRVIVVKGVRGIETSDGWLRLLGEDGQPLQVYPADCVAYAAALSDGDPLASLREKEAAGSA